MGPCEPVVKGGTVVFDFLKEKETESTYAYYQACQAYDKDPDQDFISIKNQWGLMASLLYAQMYFSNLESYKRFRRELALYPFSFREMNRKRRNYDMWLILSPTGLGDQKTNQRILRQIQGLAVSGGFSSVRQVVLPGDSVLSGAQHLRKLVQQQKSLGRKLILVSHSFGSAFVRVMLDNTSKDDLELVRGWLNLSGLIFGSPLFHCSDRSDRSTRFSSTPPLQASFSMEQKYFLGEPKTHHLEVLHFLGVSHEDEILGPLALKNRERLKAWGPSDGTLCFEPFRKLGNMVVPLINQGHELDVSLFPMTFLASLSPM